MGKSHSSNTAQSSSQFTPSMHIDSILARADQKIVIFTLKNCNESEKSIKILNDYSVPFNKFTANDKLHQNLQTVYN